MPLAKEDANPFVRKSSYDGVSRFAFRALLLIVIFRPGARSERMHGPMPQTFAAEGSDKPSANAPNVVCRCWPSTGAIPLYHCHSLAL